ncbi:MAG TPA: hypothetical protein VHB54_16380 [Mucilaginibacter sp.]|nr:hypothetical protein [Mucilaginibacter sp.]
MKLTLTYYWILPALAVLGIASCKKDKYLGYTPGTGAPTITSVVQINKSVKDTITQSTTTYSSSGVVTTVVDTNFSHTSIKALDSATVTGNLGVMYMIKGSNLGNTTKLTINGVTVYFNRSWGSDNSLIFTLPTNIPYVQPQSNEIVLTTLTGKVNYKFTTLPPPPTITQTSDFDFWANSQITLTGKGFASVSDIKLTTTGDEVTIVSKNDSTLVLKMPSSSTVTESTLSFTYTSGSNTGAKIVSSAVFNDLDNAYTIYFNNSFQNSWGDNSWSGPSGSQPGNPHAYGGTNSIEASYPAGAWQIEGWANWYPSFAYDASYKYLTFWVKGGKADHTLVLVGDKIVGGYGQVQNANAYAAQLVTVPAGVWTFVKIPLSPPSTAFSKTATALNYWATGSPAQQLGFFLQGMSGDVNETMYFDEVAFVK